MTFLCNKKFNSDVLTKAVMKFAKWSRLPNLNGAKNPILNPFESMTIAITSFNDVFDEILMYINGTIIKHK